VRRRLLFLGFVSVAAIAAAPTSNLKLFSGGFQPGTWQMRPLDADSQARMSSAAQCFATPDKLVYAGHSSADGECGHTIVENSADRATVTYVCKGRGHGRTSIRRDGAGFVVDAQGIDGRDPFEMRLEFRRVGGC